MAHFGFALNTFTYKNGRASPTSRASPASLTRDHRQDKALRQQPGPLSTSLPIPRSPTGRPRATSRKSSPNSGPSPPSTSSETTSSRNYMRLWCSNRPARQQTHWTSRLCITLVSMTLTSGMRRSRSSTRRGSGRGRHESRARTGRLGDRDT